MEKVTANRGETTVLEPTRAQRSIARRAAEARATIPHLELSVETEVDPEPIEAHSRVAVLVKACGLALREHPHANGAYRDGRFELYSRINVAIPVATGDAFAMATVFDADRWPLAELSEEIAAFADRPLTAPELSGATFSLWAPDGVASASPVIVPPHAGALGAGEVRAAPVVRDGAIVPGRLMTLTLACDHRILYGQEAAALLAAIADRVRSGAL
jgi:pyruvate dehydrogenase E2 component (dihydrolipoamide acetyltransferase)